MQPYYILVHPNRRGQSTQMFLLGEFEDKDEAWHSTKDRFGMAKATWYIMDEREFIDQVMHLVISRRRVLCVAD